ncbi:hypothetical protein NE865_05871 [Phthorimaea operculella]|nr:hypothetical protein NE865_05871 [Phthorimaea operculella]
MAFKLIVALCVLVAVAVAVPAGAGGPAAWGPAAWGPAAWGPAAWGPPGAAAGGASPFIPPWIATAPWYPQWAPCTTVGSTCADCNTKLICTKIGGIQRACTDPTLPYCNAGACSATPTAECAPATEAAAAPAATA